jgi:hypothetical protein
MTIAPVSDLHAYFTDEVSRACVRCALTTPPDVARYLGSILASRGRAAGPDRSIVLWLDRAIAASAPEQRLELQSLGDHALYVRGFFRREPSDDAVYVRVGQFAYERAAVLARSERDPSAPVLDELSSRCPTCSPRSRSPRASAPRPATSSGSSTRGNSPAARARSPR